MDRLFEALRDLVGRYRALPNSKKTLVVIAAAVALVLVFRVFSLVQVVGLVLFMLGYALISLEHLVKINKSAIALIMGALLTVLMVLHNPDNLHDHLVETGAEIFGLVVFLLCAMSLVEILVHYGFFDILQDRIGRLGWGPRHRFLLVGIVAFFLSAIIDNLTATIVMVTVSRKIFEEDNFVRAAAMIVIAANAGGAWSPLGDVTTIMMWLAKKYSASELISMGLLPSLAILAIVLSQMARHVTRDVTPNNAVTRVNERVLARASEKLVIASVFVGFSFPLMMSYLSLPPYIGLVFGLGVVWVMVDVFKQYTRIPSHMSAAIGELIRQVDIPSIKFFVGILLAVEGLGYLNLLDMLAFVLYGDGESATRVIAANIVLGMLSAIVDNVPLTAIVIEMRPTESAALWVHLAIVLGTGGSLLAIGSAAGVVAMGLVPELNFARYLRIAFRPALWSYLIGIGVWYIQYLAVTIGQ